MMADEVPEEDGGLAEDLDRQAVAQAASEVADPPAVVAKLVPATIRERYEVYSYRNAAVILSEVYPEEFGELVSALDGSASLET